MVSNNPFMVTPGNDYSSGLSGLNQSMQFYGEQKRKKEAADKIEKMKMDALEAFRTEDPEVIADFMVRHPEMSKALESAQTFRDAETKDSYLDGIFSVLSNPDEETVDRVIKKRQQLLKDKGVPPERSKETDGFAERYANNPKKALKMLEFEAASLDPKRYKAWKDVYNKKEGASSNLKKLIDERKKLIDEGVAKDDPRIKAYDGQINGTDKEIAPSQLKKHIDERQKLLDKGVSKDDPRIKAYDNKISGGKESSTTPSNIKKMMDEMDDLTDNPDMDPAEKKKRITAYQNKIFTDGTKTWSPSPLKKLIKERAEYFEEGEEIDSDVIKAYDNKIAGVDIDIEEMTPEEIDMWGAWVNLSGKMPSVGRGKQATKIRSQILKSAARQAIGRDAEGMNPKMTPSEAALEVVGKTADTKAIQQALGLLEKQTSAMGSFIQNMDEQITQITALSKDLNTFDTRLLNVPLRFLRGKIVGSPLQSKYDMYLTEIESEIGRLAVSSPQSIAELSIYAQEKWSKIHDKSLSVNDMLSLLEETRHAADIRLRSVQDQLNRTRTKMRTREYEQNENNASLPIVSTQEEYNALKSGDRYIDSETKVPARKR